MTRKSAFSRLILVRHAQASFRDAGATFEEEAYDQLSALGERQAESLGEHWVRSGLAIDAVYLGPLKRHQQTAAAVAAAYRQGQAPWPEPIVFSELSEHQGTRLIDQALPGLATSDPEFELWMRQLTGDDGNRRATYFKVFRRLMLLWVQGELTHTEAEIESWPRFRQRVVQAVERMTATAASGQTIAVFTSGGPVATAVGQALALDDEKILELSWVLQNTSCSELLLSPNRLRLKSFNTLPHLTDPEQMTFI